MAQRPLSIDDIPVSPPVSPAFKVPGPLQVGDDVLNGAIRDPDKGRDILDFEVIAACEAHEHVRVIRKKGPRSVCPSHLEALLPLVVCHIHEV